LLFRRLAEVAKDYLKKGAPLYIEGRLRTRKWQDKDGKERYTTEIEASEMKMLSGTRGDEQPATVSPNAEADALPNRKTSQHAPMVWDGEVPF